MAPSRLIQLFPSLSLSAAVMVVSAFYPNLFLYFFSISSNEPDGAAALLTRRWSLNKPGAVCHLLHTDQRRASILMCSLLQRLHFLGLFAGHRLKDLVIEVSLSEGTSDDFVHIH